MTKKHKPTTPSNRFLILEERGNLLTSQAIRNGLVKLPRQLTKGKSKTAGRNNNGRITCRHRGGGHKKRYTEIDFKRNKFDVEGVVKAIMYDANRSARIALLFYKDGEKRYIVAPNELKVGDTVLSGNDAPIKPGNALPLEKIPVGTVIHNIEVVPGQGGKLVRSAGVSAQLLGKTDGYATISLPSGAYYKIKATCKASIGTLSNPEHSLRCEAKAGRKRWMGIRPTVRGTAMNPVDHPHGGGEGRQNSYHFQSPWGLKKVLKLVALINPTPKDS